MFLFFIPILVITDRLICIKKCYRASLQLLYFYQHEIEYGQWLQGEFRIKHEDLSAYLKKHPKLTSDITII
jgi:hypothetical protein